MRAGAEYSPFLQPGIVPQGSLGASSSAVAHASLEGPVRAQVPEVPELDPISLESLRGRLPQIGTVREAWAGPAADEGPFGWNHMQTPIYGVRSKEGMPPGTSQVLVDAVGGPAWVNHNQADISLNVGHPAEGSTV